MGAYVVGQIPRKPCETCTLLAEQHPGRTVELGRQRGDGRWFCGTHGRPVPTPDPTLSLTGLQQTGYLRSLQDAVRGALSIDVDPVVLREALEAAIRGHKLATI